MFAERGLDVSMEEIAGAAGVGVGTLYRRFDDRDALIDALFEEKIGAIAELAREALEIEDPWDGLRDLLPPRVPHAGGATAGCSEVMLTSDRGRERAAQARNTHPPARRAAGAQRARPPACCATTSARSTCR